MRVVTAGIGLRAGHVLTTLKEAMPEVEIVGYYDPQPTFLDPEHPVGRGALRGYCRGIFRG